MGYRQHSDGTWEQPAEAEKRVSLRRTFHNGVGAVVIAIAGVTALGSLWELADSNIMQNGQTDHGKVALGAGGLLAAAAFAGAAGLAVRRRLTRDDISLSSIQQDVRDQMKVVDGKAVTVERDFT